MVHAPFFESPAPSSAPKPRPRRPLWVGPPENILGSPVVMRAIMARTPDLLIAATDVVAYPNGFEFSCLIRHRRGLAGTALMYGGRRPGPIGTISRGLDREQLRIGVQFSDGRKATNVGSPFPSASDEEPPLSVMVPKGGGGGSHSWQQGFWVWPLPSPGLLTFACEWLSEGIELSQMDFDGDAIRAASAMAEVLWPLDEDPEEAPVMVTRRTRSTPI